MEFWIKEISKHRFITINRVLKEVINMNENILNLDIENTDVQELLDELDEIELELINSEELDNNYGFVFASGGGSRPRIPPF